MEKLSIVTITYNNPLELEKTLSSVLVQIKRKANVELIVIDGSTDRKGNEVILHNYAGIISVLIQEYDNGIYNAMNKGLSIAAGDSILFLNSGDTFEPGFDLSLFQEKNHLEQYVYYTCSRLISSNYDFIRPDFSKINHLTYSLFSHQGIFVPKSIYKKYTYDETKAFSADYFWMKNVWLENKNIYLNIVSTCFQLGGVSTKYSIKGACKYFKQTVPFYYKLQRCIKTLLFYILGEELTYVFLYKGKYNIIRKRNNDNARNH